MASWPRSACAGRTNRGNWVIIAGERRWRAARLAGLPAIACYFHADEMSPSEVLEQQLIENLLREDLKPKRDRADLRIEPATEFSVSSATASFQDRPAPMRLTIHSSYHLAHDAPGVIAE